MYSRDPTRDLAVQGRVRVQMYNDDDTLKYPQFKNSMVSVLFLFSYSFMLFLEKALYMYLAEMIPKLKCRQPGFTQQQSQPGGSGAAGKKNKKKRYFFAIFYLQFCG